MEFQLPFVIPASSLAITHHDAIVLSGSCFTEHIGRRLEESKFPVITNPHGILFNPLSMAAGLEAVINRRVYQDADIFLLNGVWNSWDFHSTYSHPDMNEALLGMNNSVGTAQDQFARAGYLIVTFGSAYQYLLKAEYTENNTAYGVSNCHKAPGHWFDKHLADVATMLQAWNDLITALKAFNPKLQILFTVSPVRHYRDGLAENNRSKGRLLELVHLLAEQHAHCHYFPAYELVVDVLRDYRFYDQDMVHPNSQATQYVWEKFVDTYMNDATKQLLKRLQDITIAARHKERFPGTDASLKFRESMLAKVKALQQEFPHLPLEQEARLFSPA